MRSIQKVGKNILQHLFSGYLKLLKKTVAIEWQESPVCGRKSGVWILA